MPYQLNNEMNKRVILIGGGASGTLIALRLAQREGVAVTVIDDAPAPARGLAYKSTVQAHLLNVRVAAMSAFAEDPLHFARWLAEDRETCHLGPDDFVPRRHYGR